SSVRTDALTMAYPATAESLPRTDPGMGAGGAVRAARGWPSRGRWAVVAPAGERRLSSLARVICRSVTLLARAESAAQPATLTLNRLPRTPARRRTRPRARHR